MKRCFYQSGTYDKVESYDALDATLLKLEVSTPHPWLRPSPRHVSVARPTYFW